MFYYFLLNILKIRESLIWPVLRVIVQKSKYIFQEPTYSIGTIFFLQSNVRDLLQISLLVLSEFEQINELLFPLKPMVFWCFQVG